MSDLHQIQLDLGTLTVHAVVGRIDGPEIVLTGETYTWNAIVTGGKNPYTLSWFQDGELVSTDWSYTATVGSNNFELRLTVSDGLGGTWSDIRVVQVWEQTSNCPPPQITC